VPKSRTGSCVPEGAKGIRTGTFLPIREICSLPSRGRGWLTDAITPSRANGGCRRGGCFGHMFYGFRYDRYRLTLRDSSERVGGRTD
jgi:hypothetical protein